MKRVQHRRGRPLPPNTRLVARPSRWGNPFRIEPMPTLADAVRERVRVLSRYRAWLADKLREDIRFLAPLVGMDLACYCPLEVRCHADIIIETIQSRGLEAVR